MTLPSTTSGATAEALKTALNALGRAAEWAKGDKWRESKNPDNREAWAIYTAELQEAIGEAGRALLAASAPSAVPVSPKQEMHDADLAACDSVGQPEAEQRLDCAETPRMKNDIPIYFGATCKPLVEQLAGYELGSLCVPHAQADANAITRLYVRGFISTKVRDDAQARLVKEIKRAMKTPPAGGPKA